MSAIWSRSSCSLRAHHSDISVPRSPCSCNVDGQLTEGGQRTFYELRVNLFAFLRIRYLNFAVSAITVDYGTKLCLPPNERWVFHPVARTRYFSSISVCSGSGAEVVGSANLIHVSLRYLESSSAPSSVVCRAVTPSCRRCSSIAFSISATTSLTLRRRVDELPVSL